MSNGDLPTPSAVVKEAPGKGAKPKRTTSFKIKTAAPETDYIKMLVYGNFGTGKTVFASSAQDHELSKDILFISAESGEASLGGRDDIDIIPISAYSQFAEIYQMVRLFCIARDKGDRAQMLEIQNMFLPEDMQRTDKELRIYKTIVIDSLSEVQKYVMYQLLGIRIGDAKLDLVPSNPEFKEWGQNSEMIRLLIRSFRNLPLHCIFISGESHVQDETQRMIKKVALPGKLSDEVQYFFDVVGYLVAGQADDSGNIARRLWIQPGTTYSAKCRLRYLDGQRFIDAPTFGKILPKENK